MSRRDAEAGQAAEDGDSALTDGDRGGDAASARADASRAGGPATSPTARPRSVEGSAVRAGCTASTPRTGELCGGLYCGVTSEDIALVLASSVCASATAEELCSGKSALVVNKCARKVFSENLLDAKPQLDTKLVACIADELPEFADYAPACKACTLASIECGRTQCVLECAASDGPLCDQCHLDKGCDELGITCAELPNPF